MKMHKLMTLAYLLPLLAISAIRDGDGNPVTKSTQFGNVDGSTGTVGEFLAIGGGGGGGGDVKSVNGYTGVVELVASDVGALPQAWTNSESISIGENSKSYFRAVSIGGGAKTDQYGVAIGHGADAQDFNSISIGWKSVSHGQSTVNIGNPEYITPSLVYIGNSRLTDIFFPTSGGRLTGPLNIKTDSGVLDSGRVDIGMNGSIGYLLVGTNGTGVVSIGKNRGRLLVNGTNVMDAISSAGKVKSVNGMEGDVVLSAENVGAPSTNSFNELNHRVELIELTSHPNMTIVGNPTFTEGNVSGFSANDYLVFPTEVSVGTNRVEFYMSFHTSGNVTTQQNLMDSAYGLAFAIRNGTTVTAISINGTSFYGENEGGTILPNHSYRLKLDFSHDADGYHVKTYLADGGGEYTQVGTGITASAPLYPTATYWGGANPGHTTHIFGGSINLSQCWMNFNGKTVWRGYDELPKVSYDPTSTEPLDTAEKIVAKVAMLPTTYTNLTGAAFVALNQSVQTVTVDGTPVTISMPTAVQGGTRDFVVYVNNTSAATDAPLVLPAGTYYADDDAATNAFTKGTVSALYITEMSGAFMLGRKELKQIVVQ